MEKPETLMQRSRQEPNRQVPNDLNRASKTTPNDILPREWPANIHPPKMSNLIHIPLKIAGSPNLSRRSPAANPTEQLPCPVVRYKTITGKGSSPGGGPLVPPINFNKKKFYQEQLPGEDYFCPNFSLFRNQKSMVEYSELLYSFFPSF